MEARSDLLASQTTGYDAGMGRDIASPIAVDTETSGLHVDDGARVAVVSIAYRNSRGEMVSEALPFDQGLVPGKPGVVAETLFPPTYNLGEQEWQQLLDELADSWLIMHNAKFDLHMLLTGTRLWSGRDLSERVIWDTGLGNRILDPEHLIGLKPTAERLGLSADPGSEREAEKLIKAAASKAARGLPEDKRYDLVENWDLMERYARLDAEFTLQLYEIQQERFTQGEALRSLMHREMEVAKALFRMERRGIGFDRDQSLLAVAELEKAKAELANQLPFPPSVNAAKRYWFEQQGLMPYSVTPTGKPQLNKDVLRRMVGDGVQWAQEWSDYSKLDKMVSMWYLGWAQMCGADGRLRAVFNQTKTQEDANDDRGAVSGRFSVTRVQLQAIPHDYQLVGDVPSVRSLFRAKPDHELWELDLAQAEVRVASSITGCTPMIEGIRQGDDAHTIVTKTVFEIDQSHPEWDFYRAVGKRLVFAMLYGAGIRKVQEQIKVFTGRDVPFDLVESWVVDFRGKFPQFVRYSRRLSDRVERTRLLRLRSGLLRSFRLDEQTHKAFNAEIQGGVAETMKEWMLWVEENLPEAMLLQIHDSLILELPTDEAENLAMQAAHAAEQIFEEWFPGVPYKAEAKRWEDKG